MILLSVDSITKFLNTLIANGNNLAIAYIQLPLVWTVLLPDNSQLSELYLNDFDFKALDGQAVLPRLEGCTPTRYQMMLLIESILMSTESYRDPENTVTKCGHFRL